jgi:flagellar biosynthesis/type III secretory pathway protein FliH
MSSDAAPAREHGASARNRARLASLLMDELTLAPARVVALAARELTRFRGARAVELCVHPDELALFKGATELARECEIERLTVLADEAITRGGCTISSERGELDARIETRIERMLALLEGVRS